MSESTSIGRRILIVDDNDGLTRSTALVLTYEGFRVSVARDGYEAVDLVRERAYDVVLMDIKMPGMNGLEAYREMRALDPSIVVLLMTAYAVPELVMAALAEGARGIIYKPFDFDQLLQEIERIWHDE